MHTYIHINVYLCARKKHMCRRPRASWTFRVCHRGDISSLVLSEVWHHHRAIRTAAMPTFKQWLHFLSYSNVTGGLKSAPWWPFLKILAPGNKSLEGSGFSCEPGGGEGNSGETRDSLPADCLEQTQVRAGFWVCSQASPFFSMGSHWWPFWKYRIQSYITDSQS